MYRDQQSRSAIMLLIFCAAVLALGTIPAGTLNAALKESESRGEGCVSCHKDIEVINPKMADAWDADTRCEVCHYGRPSAATELEAHTGLIANPGDLRVISLTCGKCHSDQGEIQQVEIGGIGDHVGRVFRSLMATAAGEIAGTRYLWGEQKTRSALYGVRTVVNPNRDLFQAALPKLQELPPASNSDADSLLRGACLRCHLWTEDKTTSGIFRAGGCAACHVLYAPDGLSRSADTSIPHDEPGHPVAHTITTRVPDSQCLMCHNDGGARIGLNYAGLAVVDPGLGHRTFEPAEKVEFGTSMIHVKPDVHFRRGLACIDCHDTVDLHGDGQIYSHREQQVGIRCESCHGSSSAPPTFQTERGRPLTCVERENGHFYLRSKILFERHRIPVLSPDPAASSELPDIWHKGHTRLECYACHSDPSSQCYCCHMTRDDSKRSPIDWALGTGEGQNPQPSEGKWSGHSLMQLREYPLLGVNRKDRISPFVPGGQAILTHLDALGRAVRFNEIFKTAGGLYGFSMNPIQPHTVSTESRPCASCHSNRKTLGLGTEFIDVKRLGLSLNFSPDSFVDAEGNRIQDSAHEGSRPLMKSEMAEILRTESCIDCHQKVPPDGARQAVPSDVLEDADKKHHQSIQKLLPPEGR
jgi:hypothetical protein